MTTETSLDFLSERPAGLRSFFLPLAVSYSLVFLLGLVFAALQVWIHFDPPLLPPPGRELPKIFFYLVKYIHIHVFAIPLLGLAVGSFFILFTRAGDRSKLILPSLLQILVALELALLWSRWFISPLFELPLHACGAIMLTLFAGMALRVILDGVRELRQTDSRVGSTRDNF
jgi:hypothetical protein